MSNFELTRRPDGELGYPAPPGDPAGAAAMAGGQQKNLLYILWRGRWIILLMAALALGGGFLYLSQTTPIYASSAKLYVEPDGPIVINNGMNGAGQTTNYYQNQCELIKSSQILASVAQQPEVRRMKTFAGVAEPVGLLKAGVDATTNNKDDLITISFESEHKSDAAAVVNAVVEAYRAHHASRKRSTAAEVLRILQKEKRDRDFELGNKVQEVLAFKQANPTLSYTAEKGNIVIEQLAKLADALTAAKLDEIDAKGAYEAAKVLVADPAKTDQWVRLQRDGAVNPGMNAEIQQLEAQLAASRKTLGTGHSTVRGLESQVDELKARVAANGREAVEAYVATLENRSLVARNKLQQLEQSFAAQQQLALSLNTQSAKLATLESEARRLEKLCDLIDSRMKEVNITADNPVMNISVLEYAREGGAPVKPKRAVILFEALMIGLALGGGLAWLRDWMDHRLKTAEDAQAVLSLEALGVVPHMPGNETIAVRGQRVHLDPMSEVAEAYRTVRTAVYFGAGEGKGKTLLITSPTPGDGKSTTASNLAAAMAQAGQRVLLLDADFRKPSQHLIFGVDDAAGVTTVVAGQSPLSKSVKLSGIRGLYVLPCGPIPRNPSEILNSQVFRQLISHLGTKFDHIVIDSPPVVPVTDARILGSLCDQTILVVRGHKSTRKVSVQARDALRAVGADILGFVMNGARNRRDRYGYAGYGYGYYASRRRAVPAADVAIAGVNGGANGNGHAGAPAPIEARAGAVTSN